MIKVTLNFVGRLSGAIGIVYPIVKVYHVSSIEELNTKLWTDYDIVRQLKITSSVGWTKKDLEQAKFL